MSALHERSLASVARDIAAGRLSPVEVTRAVLDRIDALQPVVAAYVAVFADQALSLAKAAEAVVARGQRLGALHGIPVSVKDVYVHGPTTACSAARLPLPAGLVSTASRRLEDAGAIVVGKATTYELAIGAPGPDSPFPPARNPWQLDMDPGGSSTGSAAGVAAGMAYGSLASDSGGSVRFPAACCGVVGLKPTFGRISRHGLLPASWTFDHPGLMARTVEDVALLLDAVAGHDPDDPLTAMDDPDAYHMALGGDLAGLRVGVPWTYFQESCDDTTTAAFAEVLATLRDLGAQVVDAELRTTLAAAWATLWPITLAELSSVHLDAMRRGEPGYGAEVRTYVKAGMLVSAVDYVQAQRARAGIVVDCRRALGQVDVLALPTTSALPGPAAAPAGVTRFLSAEPAAIYTPLASLAGLPAVTVPCGRHPDGVPIGVQVVGAPLTEATVLRAAHAYEQAAGWAGRHPALDVRPSA